MSSKTYYESTNFDGFKIEMTDDGLVAIFNPLSIDPEDMVRAYSAEDLERRIAEFKEIGVFADVSSRALGQIRQIERQQKLVAA